jgi:hypothetical protein
LGIKPTGRKIHFSRRSPKAACGIVMHVLFNIAVETIRSVVGQLSQNE